jgi:DNA modification methylase
MAVNYYHTSRGDCFSLISRMSRSQEHKNKYRAIITSPPYFGHRHYGDSQTEIGQENDDCVFINKLVKIFLLCRHLLTEDGSLWIVIGDTRRNYQKLLIPHRLALKLVGDAGYTFREDIVWYKKNSISGSSKINFTQAYEPLLFLSKNKRCYTDMDSIRTLGNEAVNLKNKLPSADEFQYRALNPDKEHIMKIREIISKSSPTTPFSELPSTSQIANAYGYDPEKFCPTCYRKFKRHATRKRVGDHKHYPIFAVCNSKGKNPGNVWEISTKSHHGSEHFAIFPEDLISKIVRFATSKGDWVLDPFMGRGTTGIVCALLDRSFYGIDLYPENVAICKRNISKVLRHKRVGHAVSILKT